MWGDRERVGHQNLGDVVLDIEGGGLLCGVFQSDLLEGTLSDRSGQLDGLDGATFDELVLELVPLILPSLVICEHNLQVITARCLSPRS